MDRPILMPGLDDMATDGDLLERIRRNEPGAFEQFVTLFGDRIFGFGVRMCGEREDARDVVQETLLKAFTSLKGLQHPGAMRSWVFRVAANACLMKRRRGKFAPESEISLEDLMPSGEGLVRAAEIPDASSLPDEELERSEIAAIVRVAIRSLPAAYRIVLVMRDQEQLSTREVSEALELPETAVKMRLHRARLMVRKAIEAGLSRGAPRGAET